jgi:hypothetical protein
MEDNGIVNWVSVHRKILEWEWFAGQTHHLKVFLYILLKARYVDGKWKGIDIKRGQMIAGYKSLESAIGVPTHKLRIILRDLQMTGEIAIKTTNKYSMITVTNYDFYQGGYKSIASKKAVKTQANSKQIASKTQANSIQIATNNKVNNLNNLNNENKVNNILAINGSTVNSKIEIIEEPKSISSLWNEIVASNFKKKRGHILNLSNDRKKNIKAVEGYLKSIEDWESYFKLISQSDFLTGKVKDWNATFDWAIKEKNILKVMEGNYKNPDKVEIDYNKLWQAVRGEPVPLTQAERDFANEYGGIRQLGQMSEFDVKRILKIN